MKKIMKKIIITIQVLIIPILMISMVYFRKNGRGYDKKSSKESMYDKISSKESMQENIKYSTKFIQAILNKRNASVTIYWWPSKKGPAKYKIYRYTNCINSASILKKATYLDYGKTSGDNPWLGGGNHYVDIPNKSGKFYYCVITEIDGQEKKVFKYRDSYTHKPVKFNIRYKSTMNKRKSKEKSKEKKLNDTLLEFIEISKELRELKKSKK